MKKVHIKKIKTLSKVGAKPIGLACAPSGDPDVPPRKG